MKRLIFLFIIILLAISYILSQETPNLIPYRKGNKWGFCDRNKNIIIPIVYDDASPFSEGLASVRKNNKYGFINSKGDTIIPFKYDYAYSFQNGLAKVLINSKFGFINKISEEVVPAIYSKELNFNEGLAVVEYNSSWGYVSSKGYSDKLEIVKEGKFSYKEEISPQINKLVKNYDKIGNFFENYAWVIKKNKYGFIDKNGNETIPPTYDKAYFFSDGLSSVKKGKRWGFIDKSNNIKLILIMILLYLLAKV